MSLVLKMRLQTMTKNLLGDPQVNYSLLAVSGDANKPWSKFTPAGKLEFTVTNPEASELEAGEYLVTLTKV